MWKEKLVRQTMRARTLIAVSAALLAVVVFAGMAVAHVFTAKTSIKLTAAPTTAKAGQNVKIAGFLRAKLPDGSREPRCMSFEDVTLVVDGKSVFTTTTEGRSHGHGHGLGHFSFVHPFPRGDHAYKVHYPGKTSGHHPQHRHTCLASTSKTVTIHVTKKHH
jgi:hypothetical protein